jgi:hypothetical protein
VLLMVMPQARRKLSWRTAATSLVVQNSDFLPRIKNRQGTPTPTVLDPHPVLLII